MLKTHFSRKRPASMMATDLDISEIDQSEIDDSLYRYVYLFVLLHVSR